MVVGLLIVSFGDLAVGLDVVGVVTCMLVCGLRLVGDGSGLVDVAVGVDVDVCL